MAEGWPRVDVPSGGHIVSELPDRFMRLVAPCPMSGCWIWTGCINRGGYGWAAYKGRARTAHRVAWMLLHGDLPRHLHVCHKCDNRACVNPAHLWVGTQQENNRDCIEKGRHRSPIGSERAWAVLDEAAVAYIRAQPKRRGLLYELAEKFGVKHSTIHNARGGRVWKHVDR